MSAIVSPAQRPPQRTPDDGLPIDFRAPANDETYSEIGAIFGPEQELRVRFIGIGPAEARLALASFPGANRCVLVEA
ncbi:MAG TPA: hypothetical protein VHB74_14160 [Devosia sp.]|jgi:hypothetical protein|nr:hypothetical protein [Devosia sp.]